MQQAVFDFEEASRWADSEPQWIGQDRGRCLLLLSVVKNSAQALERWCRYIDSPASWPRDWDAAQLRDDAITGYLYLVDDDRSEWCGFVSACEMSDLDPQAVRESIMSRLSATGLGMLRLVLEMSRLSDADTEVSAESFGG